MPGFDLGERLEDSPASPDLEKFSIFIKFFSTPPVVYTEAGGMMIDFSAGAALNWGGGGWGSISEEIEGDAEARCADFVEVPVEPREVGPKEG